MRGVSEEERTIDFVASTETPDRYGDVIRVAGGSFDQYKKNPVFLWAHNASEPPIGRTVDIATEKNPPALIHRVQFADAATSPFADQVFRLYKGGVRTPRSGPTLPDGEAEPHPRRPERVDRRLRVQRAGVAGTFGRAHPRQPGSRGQGGVGGNPSRGNSSPKPRRRRGRRIEPRCCRNWMSCTCVCTWI